MGEGARTRTWGTLLACALLAVPSTASAGTPDPPAEAEPKPEPTCVGEECTAEKPPPAEAEAPPPELRVFGRVYARASADERADFARKLDIPSARLGVKASFGNVDAEVSADLSSSRMLKDAFVRLADDSRRLRLYAGQFKAPFLVREMESSWSLPLMRRGLVADYLVETQQLGGRRWGLMGEVRLRSLWKLRAMAGVFRGAEDPTFGTRLGEDASGRVQVQPRKALTLGMGTYLGEVFRGTRRHSTAVDARLELGSFQLSGELAAGAIDPGRFTAQLAVIAYRVPIAVRGWALEPVLGAEALQVYRDTLDDGQGHAWSGGLNLIFEDQFKAQLQAERSLRPGDESPALELMLQLAARF